MIGNLRTLVLSVTILATAASSASAGSSWIFLPSYYSHDPVAPVQVGPRYEGGPYYVRPQGEYVRSGYSSSQSTITVGSMGTDTYQYYESWIQVGGQY
jgi:hypothetical protein